MLEKKIKLKQAIQNKLPKSKVAMLFDEYEEAYKQLHHPSERHKQDYVSLYFIYSDYMAKKQEKSDA